MKCCGSLSEWPSKVKFRPSPNCHLHISGLSGNSSAYTINLKKIGWNSDSQYGPETLFSLWKTFACIRQGAPQLHPTTATSSLHAASDALIFILQTRAIFSQNSQNQLRNYSVSIKALFFLINFKSSMIIRNNIKCRIYTQFKLNKIITRWRLTSPFHYNHQH